MAANGPKCRRVDDCDGSCPRARVPTRDGFYFLLLRTGGRPEYRGAGTWGDPENKNITRQPRVKNINMGRTRHH